MLSGNTQQTSSPQTALNEFHLQSHTQAIQGNERLGDFVIRQGIIAEVIKPAVDFHG